ncbi:hypothetical protein [Sphingopyxis sp.]|uniref:hypothetical protein n=1 Tax=Sphingopyxis sp. TaxID=1908224 RepID=UPI003F70C040
MTKDGMMMKRVLLLVGTVALSGAANAAPAPAVNAGYDWAMRVNDEDRAASAILAYEVDGTDDQPLNFTCEEGGNRIFAGISGNSPDLKAIGLMSGDVTLRVVGTTEVDEMPFFSSDEIAGDAPLIRAFAANGWLRMTDGRGTVAMAGTARGKQVIKEFIAFCTG